MPLMSSLCDRMACLEFGRIMAEGTPDEVLHHPRVRCRNAADPPTARLRHARPPTTKTSATAAAAPGHVTSEVDPAGS